MALAVCLILVVAFYLLLHFGMRVLGSWTG